MILTVDEFRALAGDSLSTTTLGDESLQTLLDAAETEIVRAAGVDGEVVELVGGRRVIVLSRPLGVVTSITETVGSTVTTLAADDYLVHPGGYILERESSGTNSRWHWWGRVTVTHIPPDTDAIRRVVQLDLVRLMFNYAPGLTQETVGAWSQTLAANSVWNSSEERQSILGRLQDGPSMVVIG